MTTEAVTVTTYPAPLMPEEHSIGRIEFTINGVTSNLGILVADTDTWMQLVLLILLGCRAAGIPMTHIVKEM